MTRTLPLSLAFLCLFGLLEARLVQAPGHGGGPAAPVHAYEGAIATSRAVLEDLASEAGLPGLSVAVAIEGRVVWSEGFGHADLEGRAPVTPLTRFRIGSVSKALTTAAAMSLVEEGLLDLDAPITRYLPQVPPEGEAMTSRQLAGHLGGVRHYAEGEGISYVTYDDVLASLEIFADDSLLHAPGSAYEYSTYGYTLLSAVLEGAAGEPYLELMRRRVLEPFGMPYTTADHVDSIIPYRARFYRRDGTLLNARFTDNSYKWAGGGLLSTAEDLVRFGSALLAGEVLRPETVETLFTTQRTSDGEETGYGMGWRPRADWAGTRVVHHGGSSEGSRTFLLLYPEAELVIAMLTNLNPAPLFEEEAQTIAHFFLEHPGETLLLDPPDTWRGEYAFSSGAGEDEVSGTLVVTGSSRRPGWMTRGDQTPLELTAIDTLHGERIRMVGAGPGGSLNLWLTPSPEGFEGEWDWLGRTAAIRGSRVTRGTGG